MMSFKYIHLLYTSEAIRVYPSIKSIFRNYIISHTKYTLKITYDLINRMNFCINTAVLSYRVQFNFGSHIITTKKLNPRKLI